MGKRLPVLLTLGALALAACRTPDTLAVRVILSAIPPGTRVLEASLTLAGRMARETETWSAPPPGFGPSESFVVLLPRGSSGMLAVAISARDAAGCATGGGEAATRVDGATVELPLPLSTEGRSGCPLTVTVGGAGSGVVRSNPDGIACPPTCSQLWPRDSSLSLTAEPTTAAAFTTWSDACEGDAECVLTMDRPHTVSARFSRRGLVFARSFGGTGEDLLHATAIDAHGNVLIVGKFASPSVTFDGYRLDNAGLHDGFVAKLDPAEGHVLWARALGGIQDDEVYSVATYGDRVFVGAKSRGTLVFDGATLSGASGGGFLVELSSKDGALVWSRPLPGPADHAPFALASDGAGRLAFAGNASPDGSEVDATVGILSADGVGLVTRTFAGTLSDGTNNVLTTSLAFDGASGLLVGGYFAKTVDFGTGERTATGGIHGVGPFDGFVVRLTPDLATHWCTTFGGGVSGVGIGAGGRVLVAGGFLDGIQLGSVYLTGPGGVDGFVALFDPITGVPERAVAVGGPLTDGITGMAVDRDGGLVVHGFTDGAGLSNDLFVAWIDPVLRLGRVEPYGVIGGHYPGGVALDKGNAVTASWFADPTQPGGQRQRSAGDNDALVVKWTPP